MVFHLCSAVFHINETLFIHAFIIRLLRTELMETLTCPLAFFMILTEAKFSLLDLICFILHRMINKIPLVPENDRVVKS